MAPQVQLMEGHIRWALKAASHTNTAWHTLSGIWPENALFMRRSVISERSAKRGLIVPVSEL